MTQELLINRAESSTSPTRGRSLTHIRDHTFVIDEPSHAGGPGREVTPAEVFLSGVSACGVLLVESFAAEAGIPLQKADAAIEATRMASDPSQFQRINLRFRLVGPSQQQAEDLVARYKGR